MQSTLIKLQELISNFDIHRQEYLSGKYDETQVRHNFIDKFFILLGWDVNNDKGNSLDYCDVLHEDKIIIENRPKAPDYSFKIGKERVFFVEAKKPSIPIGTAIEPAFQLRRYSYTAKLPFSILTDFQEFAIYDTTIKPNKTDKASIGRTFYCKYTEYENNCDYIYNIFSKEAVLKGSLKKYIEDSLKKRGTSQVDKEILRMVEMWRENLARNIALRNKELNVYQLNEAVQKIIDRILFLRIAEDRNTEVYGSLNSLSNQTEIYKNLDLYFQKADKKYNSGLYKIETWLSNLVIEDRVLKGIIKGLYYPAPYEFSVLPIEILGNIYEQFLGKTIRLTEGHQAKVEYKPEVRKAGGVYYTPEYIVSYIVKNTVGALLQPTTSDMSSQPTTSVVGKTPEEISELKILDPACGSGSFLVNAYSYLLDYHTEYYSNESNRNKALKGNKIYQVDDKTFHLTIEEKQKILLNNIYGVDIDSQAVETTKLSLLLKLMEGEILESAGELFKHSQKALLPDLKNNIKCGNSLIGSDFYDDKDMSLFGNDEIRKINTFDWEKEFPEIIGRNEISKFHHITFATKYSRSPVPVDYDILDDEQIPILIDCFKETKDKFGVKILACAVLPEHIHLIIADMGNKITEIVKHLKGYSAMVLNRRFKSSVEGGGQQHNLWAKSFDDTFILDEKHLFNAIEYVNNNYLKHSDKWKIPSQVVQDKIKELVSPFTKWKDYEYNTGGFDCVIGNPPYVKYENLDNSLKNYAKIRYSCTESFFDIFQLFLEKSYFLINQNGLLGFIIPNLFLKGMNYKSSRHFFFENSKILIIRNYGDGVFHNVKMPTCICVFEKSNNKNKSIKYYEIKDEGTKLLEINQNNFNNQNYIFKSDIITEILNQKFIPLENYIEISRGLEIGKDKIINRNKSSIKILFGEDISRYVIKSESYIDKNIYEKFNKNVEIFKNEKIVIRETGTKLFVIYDNDGYITNRSLYCIRSKKINLKFLIGVLNSKLIQYYYENEFKSETEIFPKIRIGQVKKIPIPKIITQHQPTTDNIITLVDQMLTAQKEYHAPSTDDLSRRLIKQKIDAIDRQIDNLVYKLYDLTDEEIRIVEEGI